MDEEETVTSSSGASPDSSLTSKIRNRQRRPCLVESEQEAVTSSRERSLTVELDNLRNNLRQAEGVLSAMKGKDDPGSDVDSKYDGIGKPAQRSVRQQQHLVAALKAQIYDTEQMVVRQKKIKIHQREIADIYRQCTTTEEKIMQLEQRLHFLQREAGDDSSQACELFRDAIQEQDTLQGSIKMGIGETDARKKAKFIPSASNEIGSLEAQLRGLDIWYSDKRESFS